MLNLKNTTLRGDIDKLEEENGASKARIEDLEKIKIENENKISTMDIALKQEELLLGTEFQRILRSCLTVELLSRCSLLL